MGAFRSGCKTHYRSGWEAVGRGEKRFAGLTVSHSNERKGVTPRPHFPGAASGKPQQSQDLQTWSCGL